MDLDLEDSEGTALLKEIHTGQMCSELVEAGLVLILRVHM